MSLVWWLILGCLAPMPADLPPHWSGETAGDDVLVSDDKQASHTRPSVACLESECMVVWQALGADGDGLGVYGRCLSGVGQPKGRAFRISHRHLTNHCAYSAHSVNRHPRFETSSPILPGTPSQPAVGT